ncbi:MAG: response regulator transcription factor [Chloroflexi bacterium]|nr:response regulator transcription factor [Chloroflexota bacterium]
MLTHPTDARRSISTNGAVSLNDASAESDSRSGADHAAGQRPSAVTHVSLFSPSRLLRDGLVSLLSPMLTLDVVGSHDGLLTHDSSCANPLGHVVPFDAHLGHEAVTRWVQYWQEQGVPAHILIVELADADALLDYIEAGVRGYLPRGASTTDLVEAIDAVRRGVAHCSPGLMADVFPRLAANGQAGPSVRSTASSTVLTARELEVLHYINADWTNQQIAATLAIEVRTVKHHVHNILQKLNLRHRWDAARLAVEQGWLGANQPPLPPG